MNSSLCFNKNGMKLSKNEKNSVFEEPTPNQGNTVQMRWSAGEWIFRQMQMQISKVYWM